MRADTDFILTSGRFAIQSLLAVNQYTKPKSTPYENPNLASKYLRGHRAGWDSYFAGLQIILTADGYRCGPLPWRLTPRGSPAAQAEDAGREAGFAAAHELLLQNVVQVGRDHPPRSGEWQSPISEPPKFVRLPSMQRDVHYCLLKVARPLEPLDGKTHAVLEHQLRKLCQHIGHEHFTMEWSTPTPERVKVGLRSAWEVPAEYVQLLARIVREEGVPVGIEIHYE